MPRQQGYYSLVQYCPDPARAEVANVGVLLFSPGHNYIDVRLSKSVRHVRSVFKGLDLDAKQIDYAKRAIKDRVAHQKKEIQTLDDLKRFISLRFNTVLLTSPRSIAVEEPQRQLDSLFEELVGPESQRRNMPRPYPELEVFFRQSEIAPHVEFDKEIVIPKYNRSLKMPYVFTNGQVFHVMPYRFTSASEAFRIMGEGTLLARYGADSGQEQVFNVLPEVEPTEAHPRLRDEVLELLDGLQEDRVRVIGHDGVGEFLKELGGKAAAHYG
jgi:hypothetical protein